MIPTDRILHQPLHADHLVGVEAAPRARFLQPAPIAKLPLRPPASVAPAMRPSSPVRMATPSSAAVEAPTQAGWQTFLNIPLQAAASPAPVAVLFISVEWGTPLTGETRALFDRQVAAMKLAPATVGLIRLTWPEAAEPNPQALTDAKAQILHALASHRPRVAVLLGGFGAKALLDTSSLTLARGRWFTLETQGISCPACATWHPAQLGIDRDRRMQTWEDLQKVMAQLDATPAAQ